MHHRYADFERLLQVSMSHVDDTGDREEFRNLGGAPNNRPARHKPTITAHRSDEDRTVFTESGNSDAWIATEDVVPVRR
jgi:hypothetical protein